MKRSVAGLALASLIALPIGCASTPSPTTKTEVRRVTPPESLTEPTARPPIRVETNADLAKVLTRYVEAVRTCNGDKAAIRAWADGVEGR